MDRKLHDCPKCDRQVYWHAYKEWGGIWLHDHSDNVWCDHKLEEINKLTYTGHKTW